MSGFSQFLDFWLWIEGSAKQGVESCIWMLLSQREMSGFPEGCISDLLWVLCSAVWCRLGLEQWNWTEPDGICHQSGYKREWCLSKLFHISYLHSTSIWSPQSIGNCPHGFGRERGQLCCAAWEDAEILRAFFVHAPTFELCAFPRDFFWSSVAQISAWDWPSFLYSGTLIALDLGPWISAR